MVATHGIHAVRSILLAVSRPDRQWAGLGDFITCGRSGMRLMFTLGTGPGVTATTGGGVLLRLRRAISIIEVAAHLAFGSTPPRFTSVTSRRTRNVFGS